MQYFAVSSFIALKSLVTVPLCWGSSSRHVLQPSTWVPPGRLHLHNTIMWAWELYAGATETTSAWMHVRWRRVYDFTEFSHKPDSRDFIIWLNICIGRCFGSHTPPRKFEADIKTGLKSGVACGHETKKLNLFRWIWHMLQNTISMWVQIYSP